MSNLLSPFSATAKITLMLVILASSKLLAMDLTIANIEDKQQIDKGFVEPLFIVSSDDDGYQLIWYFDNEPRDQLIDIGFEDANGQKGLIAEAISISNGVDSPDISRGIFLWKTEAKVIGPISLTFTKAFVDCELPDTTVPDGKSYQKTIDHGKAYYKCNRGELDFLYAICDAGFTSSDEPYCEPMDLASRRLELNGQYRVNGTSIFKFSSHSNMKVKIKVEGGEFPYFGLYSGYYLGTSKQIDFGYGNTSFDLEKGHYIIVAKSEEPIYFTFSTINGVISEEASFNGPSFLTTTESGSSIKADYKMDLEIYSPKTINLSVEDESGAIILQRTQNIEPSQYYKIVTANFGLDLPGESGDQWKIYAEVTEMDGSKFRDFDIDLNFAKFEPLPYGQFEPIKVKIDNSKSHYFVIEEKFRPSFIHIDRPDLSNDHGYIAYTVSKFEPMADGEVVATGSIYPGHDQLIRLNPGTKYLLEYKSKYALTRPTRPIELSFYLFEREYSVENISLEDAQSGLSGTSVSAYWSKYTDEDHFILNVPPKEVFVDITTDYPELKLFAYPMCGATALDSISRKEFEVGASLKSIYVSSCSRYFIRVLAPENFENHYKIIFN